MSPEELRCAHSTLMLCLLAACAGVLMPSSRRQPEVLMGNQTAPRSAVLRIALAFSGKLGSFAGKVDEKPVQTDGVFNLSMLAWNKFLLRAPRPRIVTFVHSLDTQFKERVLAELQPSAAEFEEQRFFRAPPTLLQPYIESRNISYSESAKRIACSDAVFLSYTSMWYSRLRVLLLVLAEEAR